MRVGVRDTLVCPFLGSSRFAADGGLGIVRKSQLSHQALLPVEFEARTRQKYHVDLDKPDNVNSGEVVTLESAAPKYAFVDHCTV
jgi:hypothetical protein